ncbi:RICIN domain-containing protein [Streptomyces uncialis]|uniref:RICIN domain-containing protein n=1 Tax=Streptomyces uncialis TaxID=1048205 RepID=UPI003828296D
MRTRMFAALSAAAALALTLTLSSAPAQAAAPGQFTMTVVHSGKCLDIQNSSTNNGARLVQNTCDGRESQRFTIGSFTNPADTYFIWTFAGKCIARHASSNVLAPVTQENCVYDYAQAFRIYAQHPWPGEVINALDWNGGSAFCFHVEGASRDDGARVITYPCNRWGTGERNDSFIIRPA